MQTDEPPRDEPQSAADDGWAFLSPAQPGWRWINMVGETANVHIREGVDRWLSENPDITEADSAVDRVWWAIRAAAEYRRAIDDEIQLLVTEAHSRGASWTEIGQALECTRQSAHERYRSVIHSQAIYRRLRFEVELAIEYANKISRSSDTSDAEVEQALLFLEERARLGWPTTFTEVRAARLAAGRELTERRG